MCRVLRLARPLSLWLAAVLLSACGLARPLEPMATPSAAPQTPGEQTQSLPVRNEIVSRVEAVAMPGVYTVPRDATPDPDGEVIYFTASMADGAGVFRVPAAGGDAEPVATGVPFVSPLGLAISSDGQTIYVADPEADAVLVLPTSGGAATVLAGTEGTAPRNLEVAVQDGVDVLYVSGVDPADGQPALMRIVPDEDDEVQVVWAGDPLVQPEGVAIAGDGTVYLADRTAPGGERAQVHRIQDGTVETVAEGFRVGALIGATLAPDDSLLLVSALHPTEESAQVLLIELPTLKQAIFNKTIGANAGSGGVHRAHDAGVYAWANVDDPGRPRRGGGVYIIE